MEREIAPVIVGYWERAEFPFALVPKIASLNFAGGTIQGYGCPGMSMMSQAMTVMEMFRVDASVGTFLMVQNVLAMLTIGTVGDEEQKNRFLPGMARLDKIGCWGLTEPDYG